MIGGVYKSVFINLLKENIKAFSRGNYPDQRSPPPPPPQKKNKKKQDTYINESFLQPTNNISQKEVSA